VNERVRFSPSPSGGLHLGGVRTALFNWLLARRDGGTFILRIEDTDTARVVPGAAETIAADLRWLGLEWDEGFGAGGEQGPYIQSQRASFYQEALQSLRDRGLVYPCFCTSDELSAARIADESAGRAPRYHGTCTSMSSAERDARLERGQAHTWRFAVPDRGGIVVDDLVHGRVEFQSADIGDFVVVRSSGGPVYDLACVVDDAAMNITTVIRGDDHLANTARQILLHEALGHVAPHWAHLPLVTAPGGAPLSKSGGAETVAELREQGFVPLALINHAVRLGWALPAEDGILSLPALAERFELSAVSRASATHDPAHLRAVNAQILRGMPQRVLAASLGSFAAPLPEWISLEELAGAVQQELVTRRDFDALARPVVDGGPLDEAGADALRAQGARVALEAMVQVLRACDAESAEEVARQCRGAAKAAGVAPRVALPALRAALTGRAHGLPIDTVLGLLGCDRACARVEAHLALTLPPDPEDSNPA